MKTLKLTTPMDICETAIDEAIKLLQTEENCTFYFKLTVSIFDVDLAKHLLLCNKHINGVYISTNYPMGSWNLTSWDDSLEIGCKHGA